MKVKDISKPIRQLGLTVYMSKEDWFFKAFAKDGLNISKFLLKLNAELLFEKATEKDLEKYLNFEILYCGFDQEDEDFQTMIVIEGMQNV